jgi:hypothetical protein
MSNTKKPALIVTPEGFPMAYEVLAGNTADKTTLRGFLKKCQQQETDVFHENFLLSLWAREAK